MSAPSPIFVAGTGRSGTSQLANILGEHPQTHRIPIETRFIVDPGGLRDLADALTIRFDPYAGDDALRRLSDILTVRLVGRRDRDRGYTVPAAIGERHYWDAVGRLWPELVASTFDESLPAAGFGYAGWPAGPFEPQCYRRAVPTIVHIKRHPVAVVASHVRPAMGTAHGCNGALAWLKPVYDRWLAWKTTVDLTAKRYVEVRAEDLAANWPGQRRALFELLGVGDFATGLTFQSRSLENRNDQFDRGTREFVERTLDAVIPAMGYA